jgi:alcohol dehydrogenase YqhD (iron-dependent ADH family)
MVVNDFTFYNPTKVIFGKGVNARIADEIASAEISRVLLLYGGNSIHRTGVYDELKDALAQNGIHAAECGGVRANPLISKAREAIKIMRGENLEAVLAVGGGSVIDSSKAIAAGVPYDGDIWDLFAKIAPVGRALPVYAVATVSATASEMNYTSVMTNEDLCQKVGLSDMKLFPRCTAMDPSVQFSVPERQTVNGGIDAICHVLETYFDGARGVEIQMEYCEGLVRSIMGLLPRLGEHPDDYDARSQFAWAAASALNGTTWAGHPGRGDFASHALGHALSAKYDSVHGETLAVMMPAWMKYVCRHDLYAFVRFADRAFGIRDGSEETRAERGIDALRRFFLSLGAPVSLRELGAPEGDIPELADSVTRNGPVGVFKKLDTEDVLKIYRSAY